MMSIPSRSFLIRQAVMNAAGAMFPYTLMTEGTKAAVSKFGDYPKDYPYVGEQVLLREVTSEFRKLCASYAPSNVISITRDLEIVGSGVGLR